MQNSTKLITAIAGALLLAIFLTGCSIIEPVLDYPMSFFDEETGETVETTVGDAIADNSDGISGLVGNTLGGVNPLLGLLGAGGAAALLSGARRKKKAAALAQAAAAPPAEEPEVKG